MDSADKWVSVYSTSLLHNAELLKHVLNEQNVDAVVLNQQDSFYPVIGDVQLFVHRGDVIRAKKIIEDSAL
jgi:hypothetical protein